MTWPLPFYGFDWQFTFYHAARMLLAGHNPYLVATFNNPPWALLPLIPFALFPELIGTTLYFVFNVLAYAFVAHKLEARPLVFVAFMLSTPVLYGLYRLNIDALVLVGFVLPAPIGLFFVLMKPQMGFAMAIYWLVQAWQTGGIKKVSLNFCAGPDCVRAFVFVLWKLDYQQAAGPDCGYLEYFLVALVHTDRFGASCCFSARYASGFCNGCLAVHVALCGLLFLGRRFGRISW